MRALGGVLTIRVNSSSMCTTPVNIRATAAGSGTADCEASSVGSRSPEQGSPVSLSSLSSFESTFSDTMECSVQAESCLSPKNTVSGSGGRIEEDGAQSEPIAGMSPTVVSKATLRPMKNHKSSADVISGCDLVGMPSKVADDDSSTILDSTATAVPGDMLQENNSSSSISSQPAPPGSLI